MTESSSDITQIGPYRILRCLGEGGKGRVYEAEQTTPVRRTVALKVLRLSNPDPSDGLRFTAEQQALALMDHPGIAKVFDAGTEADGRQWFAMELIDGLPLIEFADQHQLELEERIRLFARVCRAVQHAHQKGIIHRDLKPSNVMVAFEDGVPSPKVIDFGVAKAVGLRLTEETLLTQFGAIIGTPAYMSPEQADGTTFDVDTRADIYSLGVMLFELLVGCLPVDPRVTGYPGFIAFLKEPDHDAPTPATRYRQLPDEQQDDVARARQTARAQLHSTLNGDLRWIVMTALEKDSARRYDSAAALGEDLDRYVRGDTVSARPPSVGYQLRRFIGRNRLIVAATALVLLALVGGTIAATVGMLRAEREAEIANSVSEFLEDVFSEASPFSRSDEEVTARQLLDRAAEKIETQLAGDPYVQGRLMVRIGAAYRGLGLFDEATPLLERGLVLLRQGEAPASQIADAEYELGYHLVFMSEFERSRELLDSAIAYYRAETGYADHRLVVAIADRVFNQLRSSEDVAGAYATLQREIGPATEALGPDHPSIGQLGFMRCWALGELGRNLDALIACRESLAALHQIHDGDQPVIAHNTLGLGHTLALLAQFDEALAVFDEVIAINSRLYGPEHPEIAYARAAMASVHLALGDRDAALRHAGEAVAIMERVHGIESTEYASTLDPLARALTADRRFEEAEALYREAIEIDTANFGPDHPRVLRWKVARASLLLHQGRLGEADTVLSAAMDVLGGPGTGILLMAGEVAGRLGHYDRAERYLAEAFAIAAAAADEDPLRFAVANFQLARLQLDRGRLDEACERAETAVDRLQSIFGAEHWRTAAAQTVLGSCLIRSGQAGGEMLATGSRQLEAALLPGDNYLNDAKRYAATAE